MCYIYLWVVEHDVQLLWYREKIPIKEAKENLVRDTMIQIKKSSQRFYAMGCIISFNANVVDILVIIDVSIYNDYCIFFFILCPYSDSTFWGVAHVCAVLVLADALFFSTSFLGGMSFIFGREKFSSILLRTEAIWLLISVVTGSFFFGVWELCVFTLPRSMIAVDDMMWW